MAEVVARCGRRKQRNPRRKTGNERNDSSTDGPVVAAADSPERCPSFSPDKPPPVSPPPAPVNGFHEEDSSQDEDKLRGDVVTDTPPPDSSAQSDDAKSTAEEGETPASSASDEVPTSTSAPVSSAAPVSTAPAASVTAKSSTSPAALDPPAPHPASEDARIQEYLARSDTAVIFPEPVSDQEESSTRSQEGVEDEELVLKCVHCTETFAKPTLLRDHMRSAHADKPVRYQCPRCDETCATKATLEKHLLLHMPTSQVCKVCQKTFANVYRLQRHMISHDESTDLRKFKCGECGKAFKFKHHLKEHVRIHSGEKPFECRNCNKRFSHSGSYSSHMTSKKCWIVNSRGRRVDRNGNSENNSPLLYSPISTAQPPPFNPRFFSSPLRGSTPPGLVGYLPYPSVIGKAHPPTTTLSPSALPCPKSLASTLARVAAPQISPDINCNTQISLALPAHQQLELALAKRKATSGAEESVAQLGQASSPKESARGVQDAALPVSDSPGSKPESPAESLTCRFCDWQFRSPVELHQHERYLCPRNRDVVTRLASGEAGATARQSPAGSHAGSDSSRNRTDNGTPNGSVNGCDDAAHTEDEDSEDHGKAESAAVDKKYRMRSLISEDQQQMLKGHYQRNPRPGKEELVAIATEVGFSKRVVQVWFQNMRARDRRRGKDVPYFPNMARFKPGEGGDTPTPISAAVSTPAYIPVVPQPFASTSSKLSASKASGVVATPPPAGSSQDQPLDLSVRRQPPPAHSHRPSPPPSALAAALGQDQALNLTCKSGKPDKEASKSSQPAPRRLTGSFQQSAIFKYMQQEGMIQQARTPEDLSQSSPATPHTPPTSTPTSTPSLSASPHTPCPPASTPSPRPVKVEARAAKSESKSESKSARDAKSAKASTKAVKEEPGSELEPKSDKGEARAVKKEPVAVKEEPMETEEQAATEAEEEEEEEAEASEEGQEQEGEEEIEVDEKLVKAEGGDSQEESEPGTDAGRLVIDEGESQSSSTPMVNGSDDNAALTTLADVSLASLERMQAQARQREQQQDDEGLGFKSKRLRKKSWRQVSGVEAEEAQLELEDSASPGPEDDSSGGCASARKKRKSWKNHRSDTEVGMYACDQCDKLFSKQSSLARHKYEHSGARPFACGDCGKAFKHKHHLTEHRRLHSGEKPFQCRKCGKRFSHSGSFSQHMNHRYNYCKPTDSPDHD